MEKRIILFEVPLDGSIVWDVLRPARWEHVHDAMAPTPGWLAMSGQTISKGAKPTTASQATALGPRAHLIFMAVWRVLSQDSHLDIPAITEAVNQDEAIKGASKAEVSAALDELRRRKHLRGYGYNKVVATKFVMEAEA